MQGRLLPDDPKCLQCFPQNSWKDELSIAESIGFDFIELLFDINQNKNNPLVNINGINEHILELSKTKSRMERLPAYNCISLYLITKIKNKCCVY